MRFYVDTCIWLNLFKKEGDPTKGTPYWKHAQDFIDRIMMSDIDTVVYTGIVLRELEYKLGAAAFDEKKKFLQSDSAFVWIEIERQDVIHARRLERLHDRALSFYDFMHVAIAQRHKHILVTRDRLLLDVAREHGVNAGRPEEL